MERRAEARLALAQVGLAGAQLGVGLFPIADVVDERLDDLPPAPLDAGQGHLQGNIPALGRAADPLESRAAPGEAFLDVFADHHGRAFAVRLERRRSVAGVL